MKYAVTTKNWDKIKNEVEKMLNGKFRSSAYVSSNGFISEVSFTYGTIGSYEGMYGFSYMSNDCSQALLRRIMKLIPKKCIEKV